MFTIRRADSHDLNQLIPLLDNYRIFYRRTSAINEVADFLSERLNNKDSIIFIAIDEATNKAIGFTQLYPTFTTTRLQKALILNDLFVESIYRGKGISKQLIDKAKSYCVATKSYGILLETERTNIIGNKLYPSQGFKKEINNFYYWLNV